jgi:hypothetical protein
MVNRRWSVDIMIRQWSGPTGVWFQEKARIFVFTATDRPHVKEQSASGAVITATSPVTILSAQLLDALWLSCTAIQRTNFSFFLSNFLLSFLMHSVSLFAFSLVIPSFPVVLCYAGTLPQNLKTKSRIILSSPTQQIFHRMCKKRWILFSLFRVLERIVKCGKGWKAQYPFTHHHRTF